MTEGPLMPTRRVTAALAALLATVACADTSMLEIRDGPQAVHPSPSPLAQRGSLAVTTPAAPAQASATRQLFETYCTPYPNNTERVRAIEASGRFTGGGFGTLPVSGYEDLVFIYYRQTGAAPQIGVASRAGAAQYCVAVDGTETGSEYYVTGP